MMQCKIRRRCPKRVMPRPADDSAQKKWDEMLEWYDLDKAWSLLELTLGSDKKFLKKLKDNPEWIKWFRKAMFLVIYECARTEDQGE